MLIWYGNMVNPTLIVHLKAVVKSQLTYLLFSITEYFFIDVYLVVFVLHVDHAFILKVAAGYPCLLTAGGLPLVGWNHGWNCYTTCLLIALCGTLTPRVFTTRLMSQERQTRCR